MRILIVNRESSHAALLGAALKKLGHRGEVCRPGEALGRLADANYDGVIAEAEAAPMAGALRQAASDLPVALVGDFNALPDAVSAVLPRVWTVVDLRRVIGEFNLEHRRFARGSLPAAEFDLDDGDDRLLTPPPVSLDEELPEVPARLQPSRLHLTCRSWDEIVKLCDGATAARRQLLIRGQRELRHDQPVAILLRLPDELVLTLPARVVTCRPEVGGRFATVIELSAFDGDRLRALVPR